MQNKIDKSEIDRKEAYKAADAILETFDLFQEGHLSLEKLFIRWEKQGNRLASALNLPLPAWQPMPSFKPEAREKIEA